MGSLTGSQAKICTTHQLNWTNEPIKMLGVIIPLGLEQELIEDLNFNPLLQKAANVTSIWKVRTISLSGRILFVNSLVASLFVYKMQVFANIGANILQKLDQIIKNFIWKVGRTKISHKILTKDKAQGGLRLVDVSARQKALKAQWIVFIHNDDFWANVFFSKMNINIGKAIWECNIVLKDVKLFISKELYVFWYDVLCAWAEYSFCSPKDVSQVLNQFIWCNSFIRVANRPYVIQNALNAGLTRIEQLYNTLGVPKSFEILTMDYPGCLTWFEYMQLWYAIPYNWKRIVAVHFNQQTHYFIQSKFVRIANESKISQIVYSQLVDEQNAVMKRKERWERKLKANITIKEFLNSFRDIYTLTVSTKLRDFQYRLLISVIVTNRTLHLWKLKDDENCSFYGKHPEEEIHLFCECEQVKGLW